MRSIDITSPVYISFSSSVWGSAYDSVCFSVRDMLKDGLMDSPMVVVNQSIEKELEE